MGRPGREHAAARAEATGGLACGIDGQDWLAGLTDRIDGAPRAISNTAMPDRREDVSTWIAAELARLSPGDRLPTMREMMRRFGTAQRVIEAALAPHVKAGRLVSRRGLGIVVAEPPDPARIWEADVLVLYRLSASRLARNLLMELEQRIKARGHRILILGFSDEGQALSILSRLGRFRVCMVQVHFEPIPLPFLAGLSDHADQVAGDGISTTGVGVDAIGTNWREALSVAMRHLRQAGHRRIGFLTSNHPARPIAMARQEYLRQAEQMPGGGWLIALDALPGDYTSRDMAGALDGLSDGTGALPFTALITWGVVDGHLVDRALSALRLAPGADLSVMILGSVDFPSEHLDRFDVVGNSNAEKIDTFEQVLLSRLDPEGPAPATHYLPIRHLAQGSVRPCEE